MTRSWSAVRCRIDSKGVDGLMRATRSNISRKSARQRRRMSRGSALVETAVTLPVCLLFILGAMEYGRYLMEMHLVNNAAREGARYAVSHTQPVVIDGVTYGNATSDVTNVVDKYLNGKKLVSHVTSVYLSDSTGNNIGTWNNATTGQ